MSTSTEAMKVLRRSSGWPRGCASRAASGRHGTGEKRVCSVSPIRRSGRARVAPDSGRCVHAAGSGPRS